MNDNTLEDLMTGINETFAYDNGRLLYKTPPKQKPSLLGKEAGTTFNSGYRFVRFRKKLYPVSHIVWCMFNGKLPEKEIDHKNRMPLDNRIENLREVDRLENSRNRGIISFNKSGVTGVNFDKERNKWRAQIRDNGKYIALGRFSSKEEAVLCRQRAELKFGYYEATERARKYGLEIE